MAGIAESFRNMFKIQELRQRILFTIGLLVIVRFGAHVTLPGVNATQLAQLLASQTGEGGGLFGLFDLFVGGAFKNAAIFSLGIMPYITASIIIQLLGAVVPYFQKLQKEGGEEGRKKITQYTRYGTIFIAALQGWGVSVRLTNLTLPNNGAPIVPPEVQGMFFAISTMLVLAASTMFLMWIGEQITDRGIGNGISLIIFIGIVARFPHATLAEFTRNENIIIEILIILAMVAITAGVVMVTQGTRRIPVQYAKRVVGRKVYGGVTQYIPLRVNTAGVMPIIFAQSIMFIPETVTMFFPESEFMQTLAVYFRPESMLYVALYSLMIIFFTYFYTAISFNPQDVSDTMKKQGGFIPGIRPGGHTRDYIENILTKITLPGSIFLAIIAVLPSFMIQMQVSPEFAHFFGGTSLLIIVGVALDTLQQIESHLLMRHYDGFMKSGKIRGRVGRS
ncbi:MAG: preprotein translocase subunit SecY [Ignavibacteria bacterium]|nr:preprotein translocase subunit SecY [Ignavibacteria bacterium]